MLSESQVRRMDFVRIANKVVGHALSDSNRKAYWEHVLEPIWRRLDRGWGSSDHFPYRSPQEAWEAAVRSALVYAAEPSGWRPPKAASPSQKKKEARERGEIVNTKAFWQGQSFGAASPVRKIDPSTYTPDNT